MDEIVEINIPGYPPVPVRIEMDPALIRDLKFVTGELRHAYTHLKAGTVIDQPQIADGLLSRQIARLETIIAELEGSGPNEKPAAA